jgi:ParB-like chromosome segregation protein Spo0J
MTEAREVMKPLEEAKGKTEDETPPSNDEKPGSVATSYINPQRTLDDWMRATKKVLSETVFMPLEMIVENPWNPNMGTPEEDESLEQVMIEQGPENIWPVTVRPQAQTVFVNDTALKVHQIVDGSRRFRKAKKLKWERMLVRIRYDLDDLAAMKLTMQMNRHGHTDWYKEARLYGSVPAKYTDKEVAAMFKVSDSHISRRKVLLALKEEDVRKAQGLGVQVTVLEEIAKMEDPKARDEAMKKVVSGDKKIVEEVKESKTKKYLCPKCHVQSPTDKYLKCERCNLYYPMKAPKKEKKDEKKEEEKKRLQKEFPHANLEKKGR